MAKLCSKGEGSIYYSSTKNLCAAQLILPNGKRKTKYGKTQKEVRDWLQTSLNQLRDWGLLESHMVIVSDFLDRFYNDICLHTLRPKMIESNESNIKFHIKPEIGNLKGLNTGKNLAYWKSWPYMGFGIQASLLWIRWLRVRDASPTHNGIALQNFNPYSFKKLN